MLGPVLLPPPPRAGRAMRAWLLGLAAGAIAGGCGEARPQRILDLETHLSHQVADLRALVAQAEKGGLVRTDGLVVAVREDVVRRMAQLALPREEVVQQRFRVRLERADVRFRDRDGAVRLEGRVGWADEADLQRAGVFVDLAVFGRIDAAAVDPGEGTLTVDIVPIGFEIQKVSVGEGQPTVRQLAESVARALPQSLSALGTRVAIPVAFERGLLVDGRDSGPLRYRRASLPLRFVVKEVAAHGGRLWLSVGVDAAGGSAGGVR